MAFILDLKLINHHLHWPVVWLFSFHFEKTFSFVLFVSSKSIQLIHFVYGVFFLFRSQRFIRYSLFVIRFICRQNWKMYFKGSFATCASNDDYFILLLLSPPLRYTQTSRKLNQQSAEKPLCSRRMKLVRKKNSTKPSKMSTLLLLQCKRSMHIPI